MAELDLDIKAGGYLPASFLDWEGHVAAVIFTLGCNFRCPWCHNGELALFRADELSISYILADIKRRAKFLDGVVISGGEPAVWPGLGRLIDELRAMPLSVKLDTNGSMPQVIKRLLAAGALSHVAMDVKAPFDVRAYERLTRTEVDIDALKKSVEIIKAESPSYEFRTTYVPALHTLSDLQKIQEQLCDDEHWSIQLFKPNGCLDPAFLDERAASADDLSKIFKNVKIRG
ncbi:MAG: anaerobic ribonucleoside-triphosphate reductase activating protein [Cloacibacillus sp.]